VLSLRVGLLVMQVGAIWSRLGTQARCWPSSPFGAGRGTARWTAKIGCESGLSSAGLMHATYGSSFARLPVLLNIVQLVGWTTFELVVMPQTAPCDCAHGVVR